MYIIINVCFFTGFPSKTSKRILRDAFPVQAFILYLGEFAHCELYKLKLHAIIIKISHYIIYWNITKRLSMLNVKCSKNILLHRKNKLPQCSFLKSFYVQLFKEFLLHETHTLTTYAFVRLLCD